MSQPTAYLQMNYPLGAGVEVSLPVSPRKVLVENATESLQVVLVPRDINGIPLGGMEYSVMVDISSEWAELVTAQAQTALQALITLGASTLSVTGQDFTNATISTTPTTCLMMNWNFGTGVTVNLPIVIRGVVVNMDEEQFLLQIGPIDTQGNYIGNYLQIDIGQVIVSSSKSLECTAFSDFASNQVIPVLTTIKGLGNTVESVVGLDFTSSVITNADGTPYVASTPSS